MVLGWGGNSDFLSRYCVARFVGRYFHTTHFHIPSNSEERLSGSWVTEEETGLKQLGKVSSVTRGLRQCWAQLQCENASDFNCITQRSCPSQNHS